MKRKGQRCCHRRQVVRFVVHLLEGKKHRLFPLAFFSLSLAASHAQHPVDCSAAASPRQRRGGARQSRRKYNHGFLLSLKLRCARSLSLSPTIGCRPPPLSCFCFCLPSLFSFAAPSRGLDIAPMGALRPLSQQGNWNARRRRGSRRGAGRLLILLPFATHWMRRSKKKNASQHQKLFAASKTLRARFPPPFFNPSKLTYRGSCSATP